jgi:CRISPR/Cas system CMR subunit Cmr4 (Cas7 group RAMP superfamily)
MSTLKYKIEFLSDWHCGSGLSSGSDLDSLCIKDELNLPFVPGKTLKGLLHEAAEVISIDSSLIKAIFGYSTNREIKPTINFLQ